MRLAAPRPIYGRNARRDGRRKGSSSVRRKPDPLSLLLGQIAARSGRPHEKRPFCEWAINMSASVRPADVSGPILPSIYHFDDGANG